jgi:hypothetical protein
LNLPRLPFALLAAVLIAARMGVTWGLAFGHLELSEAAVLANFIVAGLILATALRMRDAGRPWWIGAGVAGLLLAVVPLCGAYIEWAIIPEPGIDHGDWRGEIAEDVTWSAWTLAVAFLIWTGLLGSQGVAR